MASEVVTPQLAFHITAAPTAYVTVGVAAGWRLWRTNLIDEPTERPTVLVRRARWRPRGGVNGLGRGLLDEVTRQR
jgi:hypothetical protein